MALYRVREDPTIKCGVEHHSGVISDLEDEDFGDLDGVSSDINSDSDNERRSSEDEENNPPPPSLLKTPAAKGSSQDLQKSVKKQNTPGIPTPAFKRRHGGQSLSSVSSDPALADYFATTTALLKSSAEEGKERMARLRQRSDREIESAKLQTKLQQLQAVIGNPDLDLDTKQLAKDKLHEYILNI